MKTLQEITPQPIEKLFELKENTPIWLKDDNGYIHIGCYYPWNRSVWANSSYYAESGIMPTIQGCFESFIIAEIPKF